jgi:hypothetical protein
MRRAPGPRRGTEIFARPSSRAPGGRRPSRDRARGASLVEVAVYASLLGGILLSFFSMLSTASQAERQMLEGSQARLEADRIYELVAGELARASLATLTSPAPGASASTVSYRRVTAFATDGATGLPVPLVESATATISLVAGGLVRDQSGREVLLSPRITALTVTRLGSGRALDLAVTATCPTGDTDRATGAALMVTSQVEGTVLVAND